MSKNILTFYPAISTEAAMGDLYSRAAWFFARTKDVEVQFLLEDRSLQFACHEKPEAHGDDYEQLRVELMFRSVFTPSSDWKRALKDSKAVLLWQQNALTPEVETLLKGKKIFRVDAEKVRMEGSFYIEANLWLQPQKEKRISENREKFHKLKGKFSHYKKCHLLATGPSINRFKYEDYKDSLVVGCNSVFINEEIMARAGLDVLVFGDPIFHFGPSQYASDFRRQLLPAVRRYGFSIVIPFKYYGLFIDNYPELEPYVIGIPYEKEKDYNNRLLDDFCLKTTANILTFLMIPVGASFSNRLHILGCDGRPMDEDSYFWGHNKTTQLNDKMENIQQVHPGFFNIDYNEYYETHIEVLTGQLESCRRDGVLVTNETFSHIPPLQAIHRQPLEKVSKEVRQRLEPLMDKEFLFVSLNPDLRNEFGHYLHMDRKLLETVEGMGGGCLAFAASEGEFADTADDNWICPILGGNSYDVNASENAPRIRLWYSKTVDPLRLALRELNAFQGKKILYWYAGHFVSLNFLMVALRELDCRNSRILVNLSGMYKALEDEEACEYARRILQESRDFRKAKGVYLGTDNSRMIEFLKGEGESPLHVEMFPFTDLSMEAEPDPLDKFGVYYPSNAQLAKGFGIILQIIQGYIGNYSAKDVQFTVRCMIRNAHEEGRLLKEIRALASQPADVTLLDHPMDPGEYARHYAMASVVLIPYDPASFGHRTSGQFLDALMAGKPVVCTKGTWAGELVEEMGCGLTFDFDKPEDAATAIEQIRLDYSAWQEKVQAAKKQWLEKYSCDAFVQNCLALPVGEPSGEVAEYDGVLRRFDRFHPVPEIPSLSKERGLGEVRVVVVDPFPIGHQSATGMVKQCFFSFFNEANVATLGINGKKQVFWKAGAGGKEILVDVGGEAQLAGVLKLVREFAPDFLYIRPAGKPLDFFRLQVALCQPGLGLRTVLHVMDNWHQKAAIEKWTEAGELEAGLGTMSRNAKVCLGISPSMCQNLGVKSGRTFQWLSNFIREPLPMRKRARAMGDKIRILYSGAVASETSLHSLVLLLEALSKLQGEGKLSVTVQTGKEWVVCARNDFKGFPFVDVVEYNPSYGEYRKEMAKYDLLLMAYNFDPATKLYLQDSMANKLPEYLSSGVPVAILGPSDLATVSLCRRLPYVSVCDTNDPKKVKKFAQGLLEALPQLKRDSVKAQPLYRWMYGDRIFQGIWGRITNHALQQVGSVWAGPYMRPLHAGFSEDRFLGRWLRKRFSGGVMFDVGAHGGSSLGPFVQTGWDVHAFEPDPSNRKNLERKYGNAKNLVINPQAVAAESGKEVPFYSSPESTGISSLANFRESHQQVAMVRTTSLKDYIQAKGVQKVDFLKIDVEGYDYFALKGFPWESIRPRCVIAEFEDLKTLGLGYTWKDMARFLQNQGYQVLVSEWHPTLRYGQPHDWKQLSLFPCEMSNPDAWGNLIAFRDPVDLPAFVREVIGSLEFRDDQDTLLSIEAVSKGNFPPEEKPRIQPPVPAQTVVPVPAQATESKPPEAPTPAVPSLSLSPGPLQIPASPFPGDSSFIGSYVQALLSAQPLQSGQFLFSFDQPPNPKGCLTGWCWGTNPHLGKVGRLRISWNGTVLAESDCRQFRADLGTGESQSKSLMNSGFSFSALEPFTAPRQCTIEALYENTRGGWQNLCFGTLGFTNGQVTFALSPNYSAPALSGQIQLGLHQFAYHFHQPSKRMNEYSGGRLHLKGWCFSLHGMLVDGVRIELPKGTAEGEYFHCKPEVSRVFGQDSRFHRCGFAFDNLLVPRGITRFTLEILAGGHWIRVCHGKIVASWFGKKVRILTI
jgi:FkbM family methyltransferase